MLKVITGCTDYYFPGVKALANSIARNTPDGEVDLYCIAYGGSDLQTRLEAIDVTPIMNPPFPKDTRFPVGGQWTGSFWSMEAMYCRILLPQLFPNDERVLWLDADTLVMKSLAELETLDFGGHTTAQPCLGMRKSTKARKHDGKQHCCAVLLYNVQAWNAVGATEAYLQLMQDYDGAPGGVVETLMNEFLGNEVMSLERKWHFNAKRGRDNTAHIYHFPVIIPWDTDRYINHPKPPQMVANVKEIWEPYA
jgi:lipopolysaccharide biosynthesis glycosyltransferase